MYNNKLCPKFLPITTLEKEDKMNPYVTEEFTCILPIRRAKRMRPKMASAMENMTSPGNVLV